MAATVCWWLRRHGIGNGPLLGSWEDFCSCWLPLLCRCLQRSCCSLLLLVAVVVTRCRCRKSLLLCCRCWLLVLSLPLLIRRVVSLSSCQDDEQLERLLKYPEVLQTDATAGTNRERFLLAIVMATCEDLKKKPVCIAIIPGETNAAMGFVYRALIMLVRRKAGPHALAGVRIFLSDQAPATLHVHRLLAAMHYRTASAGTLTRGPVVAFCWFHRFIVGWGRQGASVQATCRWLHEAVRSWFYRLRSVETQWMFDLECALLRDLIRLAEQAQVVTSKSAEDAAYFVATSMELRQFWAAAYQPQRFMTLDDHTNNGVEIEFAAWKKDEFLSRAKRLSDVVEHGRRLFERRRKEEVQQAAAGADLKKSTMELGAQPIGVKNIFRLCTPMVAQLLLHQWLAAEKMECTRVSDTVFEVSWATDHDGSVSSGSGAGGGRDGGGGAAARGGRSTDSDDSRGGPDRVTKDTEGVAQKLAAVPQEPFQQGELKRGLRFSLRRGASSLRPWRYYGIADVERRYGGRVELVDGCFFCRAAGGRRCWFAREYGTWQA